MKQYILQVLGREAFLCEKETEAGETYLCKTTSKREATRYDSIVAAANTQYDWNIDIVSRYGFIDDQVIIISLYTITDTHI